MRTANAISNTVHVAIITGLLGSAIYMIAALIGIAAPMIIGSWDHYKSVHGTEAVHQVMSDDEYHTKAAALVCGAYFRASYPYRKVLMREDAWCEGAQFEKYRR